MIIILTILIVVNMVVNQITFNRQRDLIDLQREVIELQKQVIIKQQKQK